MKILITGITGFVGSHLAEYVLKEHPSVEVFGTRRWRSPLDNIEHIREGITLVESDLRDPKNCYEALEEIRPERIFHLAAQSYVPSSWKAPSETITTNIVGNVNILEAMRELKLDCPIQIACSSEEYGFVAPEECPIKETNPLRPLSPYGVSKEARIYSDINTSSHTECTRCVLAVLTTPGRVAGKCSYVPTSHCK